MTRSLGWFTLLAVTNSVGCLHDDPHHYPEPVYDPVTTQVSARADSAFREILAANPDIPMRPMLHTTSKAGLTLFHRGERELFISRELVERCENDGQLKAVLCSELGQMETERQVNSAEDWRDVGGAPFNPGIPVSSVGSGDQPDMTRTAEIAKHERTHSGGRPRRQGSAPASPRELASLYLSRAGHDVSLLDEVAPWIREARRERHLERQMTRSSLPSWITGRGEGRP